MGWGERLLELVQEPLVGRDEFWGNEESSSIAVRSKHMEEETTNAADQFGDAWGPRVEGDDSDDKDESQAMEADPEVDRCTREPRKREDITRMLRGDRVCSIHTKNQRDCVPGSGTYREGDALKGG